MICWLPFTGSLRLCDQCDADKTARLAIMRTLSHHDCGSDLEGRLDDALENGQYCDPQVTHVGDDSLPGVWTTAGVACLEVGTDVARGCKPVVPVKTFQEVCNGL